MSFTRLFEDSVQGRCFVVGLAEGVSHFVCAVSVPVDYIQCIGDEGTRIVLLHEGEILLLFLSEGCIDMWGDQVTLCAGRTIHLNLLERTVEAVEVGDVVVPYGGIRTNIDTFFLCCMISINTRGDTLGSSHPCIGGKK